MWITLTSLSAAGRPAGRPFSLPEISAEGWEDKLLLIDISANWIAYKHPHPKSHLCTMHKKRGQIMGILN
ncbi:MAG: hypothetical protein Kow00107_00420 [Planctomycetota bacterium]